MNNLKNRKKKNKNKTPEDIQVIIPAVSLLDVLRRYKKMTWPVTVTIRDSSRGGNLFFLRDSKELKNFRDHADGLYVSYFGRVRNEIMIDLDRKATVTVKYRHFRKPRNAELLTANETVRYFLYRTGDLKEPENCG